MQPPRALRDMLLDCGENVDARCADSGGFPGHTKRFPGIDCLGRKFSGRKDTLACGHGRNELDRAAQHEAGEAPLRPVVRRHGSDGSRSTAPARSWCVADQGPHSSATVQPRPGAARDFHEVLQAGGLGTSGRPVSRHGAQQATQTTLHGRSRPVVLVGEDVGCSMDPPRGNAHLGPQHGRLGQPSLEHRVQPAQGAGGIPLFATRFRLSVMALRRSCSVSPEALRVDGHHR
jgi:hypothetical protein